MLQKKKPIKVHCYFWNLIDDSDNRWIEEEKIRKELWKMFQKVETYVED